MKQTKFYCDLCHKEIEGDPQAKYIPIRMNVGKHGVFNTKIRILDETYGGTYMDFCEDCKGTIALLFGGKSNDAEPVRHGKWFEYPIADGMNQCSVCGVLRFGESNYCPNCGAYMRGEE